MSVATSYDDILNINSTYRLIERVTRESLTGAMSFMNASRGDTGQEDYRKKWFPDIDVLSWSLPFFRHIDGYDHTHFVIDIDVRLKEGEKKYSKYLDKLRIFKLAAAIEYFRGWTADHNEYDFLWKTGSSGLHAIQRINKRIRRDTLLDLIKNHIFPKCKKNKFPDTIDVLEISEYNEFARKHRCNSSCTGWHYLFIKDKKSNNYKRDKFNWSKIYSYNKSEIIFHIDLTMYLWERMNLRWIYSPVFKIPQQIYFSIPIKEWNIKWVEKYSTSRYVKDIIEPITIPNFQFSHLINFDEITEDDWIIEKTPKLNKITNKSITYSQDYVEIANNLYNVEEYNKIPENLIRMIDRMTAEFHRENISPCIKKHYEIASSTRGSHWNRFPIIRFLAWQGYTGIQIANWIRFRLNDDHDNSPENSHKLMTYLPPVLGNLSNPNPVPKCHTMQSSSQFMVCNEEMQSKCNRKHPLSSTKLGKKVKYLSVDISSVPEKPEIKDINKTAIVETYKSKDDNIDSRWSSILNKIKEVFDSKDHLVLWKSTRAGVTTTIIYEAKQRKKKILVLVPTNKIAIETFQTAINIVKSKTGQIVNGAILSSNVKSCLLLKFTEHELNRKKKANPSWGNRKLAWNKLLYHTKPTCKGCRFKSSTASLPLYKGNTSEVLVPLFESKVTDFDKRQGWCAYQTFRKHIKKLDVVFLTYAKLNSLRTAKNKENLDIMNVLINEFDVVFLDEINTLAQASPLTIPVLKNHQPITLITEKIGFDLFNNLRTEITKLLEFADTVNSKAIVSIIKRFISRFEGMKLRDWNINNILINNNFDIIKDEPDEPLFRHPLKYIEREELKSKFGKYHVILENYSKETNQILWSIERILMLLSHDEIVGYNLPKRHNDHVRYQFVVSPNLREVRGFVKDFTNFENKRIIATDACLPEANVSDLLSLDFKDFIVGDPRQTNKHQLIIADMNQIYISKFLHGSNCKFGSCKFWNTKTEKCKLTITFPFNKDGRDILIEESAFSYEKSYKIQFLFLKDIQSIINNFGADNIFLILPNKESWKWFNKYKYRLSNIKDLKVSYFRSDLTIGVECDRRIMITLGTPIPPKNSYIWLAYYYHKMGLMTEFSNSELGEKLRVNSMRSAFWQTIGRAKDPLGIERSVVFAWGLGFEALVEAFNFHSYMKDSLPLYKPISTAKEYKVTDLLHTGNMWRRHGVILDISLLNLSKYLSRSDRCSKWYTARQLHHLIRFDADKLEEYYKKYTPKQLETYNIKMKTKVWGADIKYLIRSSVPKIKKAPNYKF